MGRVAALVTGASSGIGLQYARQLAGYGYNLVLVSNQDKELKETAQEIAAANSLNYITEGEFTGEWVTTIYKDLSGQNAAQEIFDFCNSNNIEVEALINNAGIFIFNDIADCSVKRVSLILNLHMYTVTMLCRLFGEKMRERRKGYILNMSSLSAHTPFPGISLYTATKSFIRTMSIAFRLEMKEFGVRVMVVSPGGVATDLYNLPRNLQKLGVNLRVIYKPDKMVKNALHKLFTTNKKEYVPGVINYLLKPLYAILPQCLKMWGRKKLQQFMH